MSHELTAAELTLADRTHLLARERELMRLLTGLGRYDHYTFDRRASLVGAQAAKIDGLKTQMRQMQHGYERKIAKLERQLREAIL